MQLHKHAHCSIRTGSNKHSKEKKNKKKVNPSSAGVTSSSTNSLANKENGSLNKCVAWSRMF
jgi:hypothetical protein